MGLTVTDFLASLDLETIGPDRFRGLTPKVGWQRVYGGHVIAQALVAATRTVPEDKPGHSLHAYFLRPGDPALPIDYAVDRIRDGRSFFARNVLAFQRGVAILTMSASFHAEEPGLDHGAPLPPGVPHPDDLPDAAETDRILAEKAPDNVRRWFARERPLEFRPTDLTRYWSDDPRPPVQHVWARTVAPLPDDPVAHRDILVYLSDMTPLDTALFPHGRSIFNRDIMTASLDHAIWFHRPFRADRWLLYTTESPSAGAGRGLGFGRVHDLEGRLVASIAQEGLIRTIDRPRD